MKLEEILPEIRKGRKARRKVDVDEGYVQFDKSCGKLCDFNNDGVWFDVTEFHAEDVLADDWELVPEKRKFSSWLKLYDDGSVFGFPTIQKAVESISLAEHHGKAKLVETRVIEWEVE